MVWARQSVKSLADEGWKVVANCLPDFPPAAEWLAKTKAEGYNFFMAEADVTDFEQCAAMVKKIEAEIGQIDVLVNNAGITRDNHVPQDGQGSMGCGDVDQPLIPFSTLPTRFFP